jgi:hypothetical protein
MVKELAADRREAAKSDLSARTDEDATSPVVRSAGG